MPGNMPPMDLSQVPLFAALSKRMAWLTERQTVLAQNVANADTPGYVAQDLPEPDFRKYLARSTAKVAHDNALAAAVPQKPDNASGSGHPVSIEGQMMK